MVPFVLSLRGRRPSWRLLAPVLVLLAWVPVATERSSGHLPPVDGDPVDVFRPPSHPFGPGNRGLDYETPVGGAVRASAVGEVVFAGPVAGSLHVTIRHPDGLRTSYSFLRSVEVALGVAVAQGQVIGRSSGHLHFGVRAGDTYLDPQALFDAAVPAVRLVPEPAEDASSHEAAALLPVALRSMVSFPSLVPTDGLPGEIGLLTGSTARLARHYLVEADPEMRLLRVVGEVADAWIDPVACTPPDTPVERPAGRRVLVLVGGFGSTSESAAVDRVQAATLGYDADDVVRFSYAGGRTPSATPSTSPLAAVSASTYDTEDSAGDLREAAAQLRLLLAEIARLHPGAVVDVVAHSQGGVVVQLALTDLVTGPALPAAVDLVATLGSPHDGTDLATAIAGVQAAPAGPVGLALLERHLDTGLDPAAPAVSQLSEISPLMDQLADASPPTDVRLLTIGARGDLTVPANHTRLWSAPRAVIDLAGRQAHTELPGDPATTAALARGLGGQPPDCRDRLDTLFDIAGPEAISAAEDALGAAAWVAAGGLGG